MNIVENQRRAYLAQAQDTASVLASRLQALSPAQQAAILASCAKEAGTPVDSVFLTEHRSDALEAAAILDGDLTPTREGWGWQVGSGCEFRIVVTQGDQR